MRTWLITGASTGFGRALADEILASTDDKVVGTLRQEDQRKAFEARKPGKSFGVLLDVTDEAAIPRAVADIESKAGPIDVLVNNAGYGHSGTIEETSMAEYRRQFDVNVFGLIAMTKAVLPSMRARRSGRILNISSIGGLTTFPGLGVYHGSKFAVEGLTEALNKEVRGFGIFCTAIEPAGFRTDWSGRSMINASRSIADYDPVMNPMVERRAASAGKQAGDPVKFAKVIVNFVNEPDPPGHLVLGVMGLQMVRQKLTTLQDELTAWEKVSHSTEAEG